MCVYANRSNRMIYHISKYKMMRRAVSLQLRMIENSSKNDIATHLFFSMYFLSFYTIYVISEIFSISCDRLTWCIDFPRAFVRFEIKTSFKDQGEVGSNNFDPRTPCEEYLSININDLRSTHNAENYIIAVRKHME